MPHQCTSCGHVFADGSKEMLSGCPDCGGTKFQFHPEGTDIPAEPPAEADPPESPTPDSSVAGSVGSAAATVRDLVGSGRETDGPRREPSASAGAESTEAADGDGRAAGVSTTEDAARASASTDAEDAAQSSARTDVVSPDELPDPDDAEPREPPTPEGTTVEEPDESDRPDLSELREELNEQFESIKVVEPGQYELNLMELYDREEYIIALEEDGRYSIQVPETWGE